MKTIHTLRVGLNNHDRSLSDSKCVCFLIGIAWTLYNLATHPEHQEKCRQEVDAIFSEKDEDDKDITRYSLDSSDAQ